MKVLVWSILVVAGACASPAPRPEPSPAPATAPAAPAASVEPASPPPSVATTEPAPPDCTKYRNAVMNMKDATEPALLMEAADCLHAEGKVGAAISIWRAVVLKFTNTPDAITALRRAGESYEQIGHFAEAADMYDDYARRYPKQADAEDKLVQATCFRHSLGQDREAASDADLLTRNYRRPPQKPAEICAGR